MNIKNNIGHMYLTAARGQQDKTAFVLDRSRVSYGFMEGLILSFAVRLQNIGISRSSIVAISTDHFSVGVAAYQAIALLGGSWVHATREALDNEQFPITHLLHDGTKPMPTAENIIAIDKSWSALPESVFSTGKLSFNGQVSDDDIWMYAQSSGTTGIPKLIPLTYGLVGKRLDRIQQLDMMRSGVIAGSPPALSQPGVFGACSVCLAGGTLVSAPDQSVWQSEGVTSIVGSPLQHMKRLQNAPIPKKKYETVNIGGAKATPKFINFIKQYAENVSLSYGATETGMVSRNTLKAGDKFDDLGKPFDFVTVEVVDEKDQQLPSNVEGIIRIKSPDMASGYIYSLEATKSAFRDGWFYPGDVGVIDDNGHLTISGRVNDQVSIGGVKVNAVLVDGIVEGVAGVNEAMAFTLDTVGIGIDSLVLMVSLDNENCASEEIAEKIRATCKSKISRSLVPTAIFVVDEIPKNERGKPLRKKGPKLVFGLPAI